MSIVKKILKILSCVVLIIVAIYSTIIIFQKNVWKDKVPSFMGYKNFIILTGSMEPTLNTGDIVFVKETTDIKEQDIISFKVNNSIVTHRIIETKKEENKKLYITKGDANSGIDSKLTSMEEIEGKYVFKIPLIGNVIIFLKSPLGIAILLLILITFFIISFKKTKKKPQDMKKGSDNHKKQKNN